MPFHGTCPKKGVLFIDFLLSFCFKLFNQNKKDNVGKTNGTFQLLHLITIGKISIIYNKKSLENILAIIIGPKFGLLV
jgi:hypothetical protein